MRSSNAQLLVLIAPLAFPLALSVWSVSQGHRVLDTVCAWSVILSFVWVLIN